MTDQNIHRVWWVEKPRVEWLSAPQNLRINFFLCTTIVSSSNRNYPSTEHHPNPPPTHPIPTPAARAREEEKETLKFTCITLVGRNVCFQLFLLSRVMRETSFILFFLLSLWRSSLTLFFLLLLSFHHLLPSSTTYHPRHPRHLYPPHSLFQNQNPNKFVSPTRNLKKKNQKKQKLKNNATSN